MTSAGPGSSVSQARAAGSRVVKVFDSSFKEMKRYRYSLVQERHTYPPVSWGLFYFLDRVLCRLHSNSSLGWP